MNARRVSLNDADCITIRLGLTRDYEESVTAMDNTDDPGAFAYAAQRARETVATYRKIWTTVVNHGAVEIEAGKMMTRRHEAIERWKKRVLR